MDKLTAVLAILGILIQVLILALLIRRKPARERGAMLYAEVESQKCFLGWN